MQIDQINLILSQAKTTQEFECSTTWQKRNEKSQVISILQICTKINLVSKEKKYWKSNVTAFHLYKKSI